MPELVEITKKSQHVNIGDMMNVAGQLATVVYAHSVGDAVAYTLSIRKSNGEVSMIYLRFMNDIEVTTLH